MKTFKKISLGLVILFGVLFFGLLSHNPALAAGCGYSACSQSDITSVSDWTFQDQDNITATFNGAPVTFTDNNPNDGNHRYDAKPGIFCSGGGGVGSITITDWSQVTSGADPVRATKVDIDYYDTSVGTTAKAHCRNWGDIPQIKLAIPAVSISGTPTTVVSPGSWIWQAPDIVRGDKKVTLAPINSDDLLYGADQNSQCNGGTILKLDSPQGNTGNLYSLATWTLRHAIGNDANGEPGLVNGSQQPYYAPQKCIVTSGPTPVTILGSFSNNGQSQNCVYQANGSWSCTNVGSLLNNNNNGSGGNGSCESNFVSPFAWVVCPALSFADEAIGAAYGQVENQLCFNTGTTSSTGGIVCGGKNSPNTLTDGVKNAWNIFKNIASALLVIAMLIMVISQAIGGGPFDAYTVRKMLPKLVAAVIIMQLSFVLLKWAIDISNDAGSAIGSLMMAPFGGPDNMNLANMIGRVINTATGANVAGVNIGQTTFDVFGTIAGIAAFVYLIPTLPLLALYVFVGVFIAFFVLILRKLLIIMLVILAPLALIAWVLPGTDKYWKLWTSNFSKLLAMFPLIMAMLAAGRIFAYITSTAGNSASLFRPQLGIAHLGPLPVPYVASVTGFADLAIIIGAFFAPYFLLPKTFSWGGTLLGSAGKAIENMTNKASESPKKFLKTREESYRGERKRRSQERVSRNEDFDWRRPWQKPIDLARSGKIDPTLGFPGSRRRQQAMTRYAAQGAESADQDIKEADARAKLLFDQADNHDALARLMADGGDGTYETHEDAAYNDAHHLVGAARRSHRLGRLSESEIQAGLNAVAKYGGGTNMRYLDARVQRMKNSNNPEERAMAKRFLDANVQTLQTKMKHLYYGNDRDESVDSMVDAMSESSFVGMEGAEMETVLGSLSQRATRGDAAAANRLTRVLTFYESAINNETIRPNITSGVNSAVEALVDNQNLDDINLGPIDPNTGLRTGGRSRFGNVAINAEAADVPAVAPHVAELRGRIDQFGNIREPATPPAPAAPPPPPGAQPPQGSGRFNPPPGSIGTPV